MKPNEIIEKILKSEKENAREEFRKYLTTSEHSEGNFRYFLGYYDNETRKKVIDKVGDLF